MSNFVEVTPLGVTCPMLLNLDTVKFIGEEKSGRAYICYRDRTDGYQRIQDSYNDIKQRIERVNNEESSTEEHATD